MKSLRKNSKGFTIIEVLIVLAIAALILLIVFLAVPALQRNSRNTQIRNAAATILSTANESITNSNGAMPTGCSISSDGTITIDNTTDATSKTQGGYTCVVPPTGGAKAAGNPTGAFNMVPGQKCNGTALTAQNRAIAVTYTIETSSTTAPQCSDS